MDARASRERRKYKKNGKDDWEPLHYLSQAAMAMHWKNYQIPMERNLLNAIIPYVLDRGVILKNMYKCFLHFYLSLRNNAWRIYDVKNKTIRQRKTICCGICFFYELIWYFDKISLWYKLCRSFILYNKICYRGISWSKVQCMMLKYWFAKKQEILVSVYTIKTRCRNICSYKMQERSEKINR